jgi:anti-anti-sigma regulatory factor
MCFSPVVLKITTMGAGDRVTLRLDGRLVGPWADEFRKALDACGAAAITVDLSNTTFADGRGRRALADARARGARFITAGPLMEALVGQEENRHGD